MIKIRYPEKKPSIKSEEGKEWIFCAIRKRWMVLTPEEWVRQNVLLFFIEELKYPASLMSVERRLRLGEVVKRFDIVLYKDEHPFLLVECKEMNVPISQKTLEQVMRYNISLQAAYFVITNGTDCFAFKKQDGHMVGVDVFPIF
jgi:hypothetical protein